MLDLRDAMAYLIKNHPEGGGHELSEGTLIRLLYLSDWGHAMTHMAALTPIRWTKNEFGAYSRAVFYTAYQHPNFFTPVVRGALDAFAQHTILLNPDQTSPEISLTAECTLKVVLEVYGAASWTKLVNAVAFSYPIYIAEHGAAVDVLAVEPEVLRGSRNFSSRRLKRQRPTPGSPRR